MALNNILDNTTELIVFQVCYRPERHYKMQMLPALFGYQIKPLVHDRIGYNGKHKESKGPFEIVRIVVSVFVGSTGL